MAEYILSADETAEASREAEHLQRSLRSLKNRLQARFPSVKSSHLTEAIAAGLGYQSNAALRAELAGPESWRLLYRHLEALAFRDRLLDLKYPLQPDLRMGEQPPLPTPSDEYEGWLQQLHEHDRASNKNWDAVYELRRLCANEFARVFELGHRERRDDKRVVRQLTAGIDHGACLPSWGERFNSHGALVEFPGTDHSVNFHEALPLSSGKVVEYQTAMVSMPYAKGTAGLHELREAAFVAGQIGWTCTVLPGWSWYAPGATTLVLFKRTTSHQEMLKGWSTSFKRWVFENRARLMKNAGDTKRMVIEDILHCQHMPLDLVDFEDCRERYFKEFARRLYDDDTNVMGRAFKRLMEAWRVDVDAR